MFISVLNRVLLRSRTRILSQRLSSTCSKTDDTSKKSFSSTDSDSSKNWISYGYDMHSKKRDRNAAHSGMFVTITLCLVFGGFYLAYIPDLNLRDWATREAFLELRRREDDCADLVSPDLIDPSKIELPCDEDLEGMEIII